MRSRTVLDEIKEAGRRLSLVREALGLSQVEVCKRVGVGTTTWNNWETGKRKPDPIVLTRFSNFYGVTLDYIFKGDLQGLPGRVLDKLVEPRAS